jgi:hypothetical protein
MSIDFFMQREPQMDDNMQLKLQQLLAPTGEPSLAAGLEKHTCTRTTQEDDLDCSDCWHYSRC